MVRSFQSASVPGLKEWAMWALYAISEARRLAFLIK